MKTIVVEITVEHRPGLGPKIVEVVVDGITVAGIEIPGGPLWEVASNEQYDWIVSLEETWGLFGISEEV